MLTYLLDNKKKSSIIIMLLFIIMAFYDYFTQDCLNIHSINQLSFYFINEFSHICPIYFLNNFARAPYSHIFAFSQSSVCNFLNSLTKTVLPFLSMLTRPLASNNRISYFHNRTMYMFVSSTRSNKSHH